MKDWPKVTESTVSRIKNPLPSSPSLPPVLIIFRVGAKVKTAKEGKEPSKPAIF